MSRGYCANASRPPHRSGIRRTHGRAGPLDTPTLDGQPVSRLGPRRSCASHLALHPCAHRARPRARAPRTAPGARRPAPRARRPAPRAPRPAPAPRARRPAPAPPARRPKGERIITRSSAKPSVPVIDPVTFGALGGCIRKKDERLRSNDHLPAVRFARSHPRSSAPVTGTQAFRLR